MPSIDVAPMPTPSLPAGSAGVVSGWTMTNEEVIMWCGHLVAPVPAEQIGAWDREDGRRSGLQARRAASGGRMERGPAGRLLWLSPIT